jgi:hypothetical protein
MKTQNRTVNLPMPAYPGSKGIFTQLNESAMGFHFSGKPNYQELGER